MDAEGYGEGGRDRAKFASTVSQGAGTGVPGWNSIHGRRDDGS